MDELLPCPECEGADITLEELGGDYLQSYRWECRKCPPLDQWYETKAEATGGWNRRAHWRLLAQELARGLIAEVDHANDIASESYWMTDENEQLIARARAAGLEV